MPSSRCQFLGLDIGTSSVKACLVDERGRTKASAAEPLRLRAPHPGWAEQDPADWWKAAVRVIKRVTGGDTSRGKGRGPKPVIDVIGLSGQMHTSVFLDRTGRVIRPALLWCDGRTTAQCRAIAERVSPAQLRSWVSNPPLEGFTLPKILWLRDVEPAAFARLAKVLMPKDYIRMCLTGVMAAEPSDASGTLLFDVARVRWSGDIARALELSMDLMPQVGQSSEILGRVSSKVAALTGLVEGTPVVGGGADNACGAIGVGAVSPGSVVASWGTSGTVLSPTARPVVDPEMRAHTFCHAVPDTWYVMGVMLSAGAAFAWHQRELAREWAGDQNATVLLNREAARVPVGAAGLSFLPYLQGERTPHRDADARGAFVGLSLAHTRAHMTRAVLEGICFGLRDCQEIISGLGLAVPEILFTGGGAKAAFIRQLEADISGKPVVPVDQEEGPAFGAALLGAVGIGAFESIGVAVAKTLRRAAATQPRKEVHAAYAKPYDRYRGLYAALRAARDAATGP